MNIGVRGTQALKTVKAVVRDSSGAELQKSQGDCKDSGADMMKVGDNEDVIVQGEKQIV